MPSHHTPSWLPLLFMMVFLTLIPDTMCKRSKNSGKIGLRHNATASHHHPNKVVLFAKNAYQELGARQGNITLVADLYKGEFDQLNSYTKGQLGDTLSGLFEIRTLDLQNSILHARKMQELIAALLEK
jgi:hypothetical protein